MPKFWLSWVLLLAGFWNVGSDGIDGLPPPKRKPFALVLLYISVGVACHCRPALGVTGVWLFCAAPGRGPLFCGPSERLPTEKVVLEMRRPAVSFRVSVRPTVSSPKPAICRSWVVRRLK